MDYATLHALEVTYFAARGYEYREGWAAGEETDEWWHGGTLMHSSAQGHIFSAQKLLSLIKKNKINIEFTGDVISASIGELKYTFGSMEESVLFTLIVHYWNENKTQDRIHIIQQSDGKVKMTFDGITVVEESISLALMGYYEKKKSNEK